MSGQQRGAPCGGVKRGAGASGAAADDEHIERRLVCARTEGAEGRATRRQVQRAQLWRILHVTRAAG